MPKCRPCCWGLADGGMATFDFFITRKLQKNMVVCSDIGEKKLHLNKQFALYLYNAYKHYIYTFSASLHAGTQSIYIHFSFRVMAVTGGKEKSEIV